jgi:hypothetical protein
MCASIISAALYFQRLPTKNALADAFTNTLLQQKRFKSVAGDDGTWQPVEVDLLGYHIVEEEVVPETGMRQAIEELMAKDLDDTKPLWRAHLLPSDSGLSVVMLRIHHCIGDGAALGPIFDALSKQTTSTALKQKFDDERDRLRRAGPVAKACRGIGIGCDSVRSFVSNSTVPMRPLETETKFTKSRAERQSGLRFGERRVAVMVPPHSLEYVKAIKNAANVSLNDVVLSATTGALRRYCERLGDSAITSGQRIKARALIPIAIPEGEGNTDDQMQNNFAFISCRIDVSSAQPTDRLKVTNVSMNKIKRSTKAPVSLWITNKMAPKIMGPAMLQKTAHDMFARHQLVFSNVPGPPAAIVIAGEKVEQLQVLFPNIIPQVILVSYNGRIMMNWVVDPDTVSEPDALAECYLAELAALGDAFGVSGEPVVGCLAGPSGGDAAETA